MHATMVSPFDSQFRLAIEEKRLIQLSYGGKLRVAEPHDYGVFKGETRLFVYQVRGASKTQGRQGRGWRLLYVDKVAGCIVIDETFPGSRADAHKQHLDWDVVYARVGPA
jgi:hypothetical protein